MNRITRDQLYIEVAGLFAKRSTCYRANVGAVITHENRIVSTAYNGSPPGQDHCTGRDCPLSASGGCSRSIHAEVNALKYCSPYITSNLILYVTHSPCLDCAKTLVSDGRINKIYYSSEYRLRDGINYLLENKIELYRLTQSGYIINVENNTLVIT
jgi:dCMP deaminase